MLGLAAPEMNLDAYPNPGNGSSIIKYSVDAPSKITIVVYDMQGKLVKVLTDKQYDAGVYTMPWNYSELATGTYVVTALKNGVAKQVIKVVKK